MKHLVKALCHRYFGDRRDCTHEHIDISQELINCLANTGFNFSYKSTISFVTFPLGLFDDDSDSDSDFVCQSSEKFKSKYRQG